jgi:PPOX class probable F420-dependent enzyme
MARRARAGLSKALADFVNRERVGRVATSGAGGVPHLVPVCHIVAGGKVYFASGDDGRKVRNMAENPRAALTVDLYSDHWGSLKGVMVQGRARLIEGGPRFRRIRDLLYRKYPQYAREAAISPSDSVVVELTPTRVFAWGFD